jgi:hypothetical protein
MGVVMILKYISVLFITVFSLTLHAVETKGFLTSDDIALFHKQGYIVKARCFTPEEMEQMSKEVAIVIDRAFNEIESSQELTVLEKDQFIYIDGSRVVYKKRSDESISIARINGCGGIRPALLNTLRSDKMVHTFFELLGANDLEHLISQIHPKLPGDGVSYPKHRDIQFRKSFDPNWQDVLGNGSYAICIIPIDPMTPENGGLWIDKNSYPESEALEEDLFWVHAEPGDLLFMHPHLCHGSGPNLALDKTRKTLLTGFCAFGANHKPYPGAYVNTRFTLTEDGQIAMSQAPWSQAQSSSLGEGH